MLKKEQEFPTVLIDEAAQLHEAGNLVVLRSDVERLILVGDPRQLPAVVSSDLAVRAQFQQRPLFERLQLIGRGPDVLEIQYRMHPDIIEFECCLLRKPSAHRLLRHAEKRRDCYVRYKQLGRS